MNTTSNVREGSGIMFDGEGDEEEMAANIQSLIDLLSSKILMYDIGHIQGE